MIWPFRQLFNKGKGRPSNPLPAPKAAPVWTDTERDELRKFLGSATGRSFLARARAFEAFVAVRGAQDTEHTIHSAGRAAGVSDAVNWIESLSRVTGEQVTETTSEAPPEGEAELLERMSP